MKYLVCEKPGKFVLGEKTRPIRSTNQTSLKVEMVGICGTDLHAYRGNQAFFTYPRILGHELSARIIETDAEGFTPGQRVIVIPYINCEKCFACRNGKTNCCVNMQVMGVHIDGGMQEEILIPNRLLIDAADLSAEEVTIVEPLSIGAHAIKRGKLNADSIALVIGCGPIGVGILKLAQLAGATVIAMDTDETRLDFVKSSLGVRHVINARQSPLEKVKEITRNELASIVFDATGNKAALEKGADYMSHGGSYVLVGLSKENLEFNHPSIHAKESTILCSRNATREDFVYVRDILKQKLFPTSAYITHKTKIEHLTKDIEIFTNPKNGVMKALSIF